MKEFYKAIQVVFENLDKKIIIYRYIQKLYQTNRLFY